MLRAQKETLVAFLLMVAVTIALIFAGYCLTN